MTIADYEAVRCNVCGAAEGDVVADQVRAVRTPTADFSFHVRLVCCCQCGLVYWSPRLTAGALERYYRAAFRSPADLTTQDDARRLAITGRVEWLRRHVEPGLLLEIGSAEGFFLQRAGEVGFEVTGLEPSAAYAAFARAQVPQANVVPSFIDQYDAPGSADVVCSFFVLEHSLDALNFLRRCHRYLKPGGRCVIEVPDVGRYGEQTGDMLWHEHTYHFTQQTITRLFGRAGFRVDLIESPGPSYPFGMAILAIREVAPLAGCDSALPDEAARQGALAGFRRHELTVAAYRSALRATVNDVVERVRNHSTRLAVYGTGVFFDQLFTFTDLRPSDIALLVDDNEAKWGTTTLQGIVVEPPSRLGDAGADVVLVASDAFEIPITARVRATVAGRHGVTVICPHSTALSKLRPQARR